MLDFQQTLDMYYMDNPRQNDTEGFLQWLVGGC